MNYLDIQGPGDLAQFLLINPPVSTPLGSSYTDLKNSQQHSKAKKLNSQTVQYFIRAGNLWKEVVVMGTFNISLFFFLKFYYFIIVC